MLTDRAPFEYLYLSKRLLTDLLQHYEAAKPRSRWSFTAGFGQFGLRREQKPPDYTNLRDLAMRSAELVSDNTGDVAYPGAYVRDTLDMWHGVFSPHMGWDGHVACYRGQTTTHDGRVALVTLFGSASNVVGRRSTEQEAASFYPSDMQGLYSMLDAVREPDDPQIDLDYLVDDYTLTQDARADVAVHFAMGAATRRVGTVDFLARVFIDTENHASLDGFSGRIIVGTPIWIATPRPHVLESPTRKE